MNPDANQRYEPLSIAIADVGGPKDSAKKIAGGLYSRTSVIRLIVKQFQPSRNVR